MAHETDTEQGRKRLIRWANGRPIPTTARDDEEEDEDDDADTVALRDDKNKPTDE